MPDWLIEGDWTLVILFGLAAGLAFIIWSKTKKKYWLAIGLSGVGLIGSMLLLDRIYESDREQIKSNLNEMVGAVPTHDFDTIFRHIADDYRYHTANKADFRSAAERIGKSRRVREMIVWRVQFPKIDKSAGTCDVTFQFKIKADGLMDETFFFCKSAWVKSKQGRWRLQTFTVFPLAAEDQPIQIPGLG